MLNRYPLWKYLLIVTVLALGVIYALPNLYPDDPAIQISGASSTQVIDQADLDRIEQALAAANLPTKGTELGANGRSGLVRLVNRSDQLKAQDVVRDALGARYVVAQNLAQTTPDWLSAIGAGPMTLGLDLSGGVHFLLQVDMDKAIESRVNVYQSELRGLMRSEGIRYRSLPTQGNTLQFGFADEDQRSEARRLIAGKYNQFVTANAELKDQAVLQLTLSEAEVAAIRDYAVQQNLTTVRNRVNELGVAEPLVQRQGANRIVVELPGVQDTAEAKRVLGKTANLEFRLAAEPDAPRATTESFAFRSAEGRTADVERSIIITGDQVTDARSNYDENGRPQVNINLDSHGGELMNRATRSNIGRGMAVLFIEQRQVNRKVMQEVDGVMQEVEIPAFVEEKSIISLATIQSALGNQFRITGLDSPAEASELALLLRAGGLAAPMHFVEERTIGPSLGAENIAKGVTATQVGFALVLVFMVLVYRAFGVFAGIALSFNLVLLLALMSMLGATLTLPGIAGIVLTLGMAVDANVLIFSRIKEEIANGMSPQRAVHEGFDKAFSAIVDGNLTTLLVGVILFAMGSGPIKGFAVTLSLGIVTSMFSAIMVTRALVNLTVGGRDIKKLWL
ncbi:protein translocase subunit SecD [Halopseudomonas aestusnigri]|jgi:preprotein translocase subunit SecD|uniref:protein translocase subunit SecD n=1 Tax=Halopseudomonas TaxID=2901189 RepID=UPI001D18DA5B|nr:protein translocase subunit SecD [Halopseudomonas aestusnigri]MCC4262419.1 protein translocase subunit SecD [Halopseudomonas aestusnigri]MCK5531531.1 protein translocase subunit SecD [Halopseudomonas aestusnigri]UGV31331.1 protein translocase subunit SecD [Halopseudomonas aestusnigri]|tara:strand:+ start:995 stop:2863 length:1869 start_codon:yes stop_codon:yes gene_type:complete